MKKLLCILLAFTMITSLAIIGVNAEETERFTTYKTKLNKIIYVDTETNRNYEYLTTGVSVDGSEFLLMNWFGGVSDEVYYQTLGEFVLLNPHTVGERQGPYFIILDNEIYSVADAYEKGIVDGKKLYDAMQKTIHLNSIKYLGDINDDDVLNIIDATFIQSKLVSDMNYFRYADSLENCTADYNCDGKVNVVDATAIQKAIVNL